MNFQPTARSVIGIALIGLAPLTLFTNCGEAEERIDCTKVCNRYAECFDSDYDVDGCIDSCDDTDDVNDADQCESCIDGLSCTESFTCTGECAGLVP